MPKEACRRKSLLWLTVSEGLESVMMGAAWQQAAGLAAERTHIMSSKLMMNQRMNGIGTGL